MRWTGKVNVPGHGFLGAAGGLLIGDASGSAAWGAAAAVYEKRSTHSCWNKAARHTQIT